MKHNPFLPFIFFLLFCFAHLSAQSRYAKSTASVYIGTTIVPAADSGWYLFGNKYNTNDVVFSRFNSNGVRLWSRFLQNNTYTDRNVATIRTQHNRLAGVATTTAIAGNGSFIYYLDTSGTIIWTKTINANNPTAITEDSNGDLYITILNQGVLRLDSMGNVKWRKTISFPTGGEWYDIKKISPQRFILTGNQRAFCCNTDCIALTCIDSSGTVIWSKAFGRSDSYDYNFYGQHLLISSGGDIYISGLVYRQVGSLITFDDLVMKIDTTSYAVQWSLGFGTDFQETDNGIQELSDGTFVQYGTTAAYGNCNYLTRFDNSGYVIRTKRSHLDAYSSVMALPFGAAIVPGLVTSNPGIAKLAPDGSHGCNDTLFYNWPWQEIIPMLTYVNPIITTTTVTSTTLATTYTSVVTPVTLNTVCSSSCNVQALFSAPSYRQCINDTMQLANNSINANSYKWYVNNVFADSSFQYVFSESLKGIYQIKLVAKGPFCSDSMSLDVEVDSFPSSAFTVSGGDLRDTFSITSPDSMNTYIWDFGDGGSGWEQQTVHFYSQTGYYNVTVTASNFCGTSVSNMLYHAIDTISFTFDHHFDDNAHNGYQYGTCAVQLTDGKIFITGIDHTHGNSGTEGYNGYASSDGSLINASGLDMANGNSDQFTRVSLRSAHTLLLLGNSGGMVLSQMDTSGISYLYDKYTYAGGVTGTKISNTRDGGFNIAGSASSVSTGIITVFNSHYIVTSTKKYTSTTSIAGTAQLNDGTLLLAGNYTGNTDIALIKTDSIGTPSSFITMNGGQTEQSSDIIRLSDGNVLVAGTTNNGGGPFPLLLKTDANGNVIWSYQYAFNTAGATPTDIIENPAGDILIWTKTGLDGCLLKISSTGTVISCYQITDVTNAHMTLANDGGVIICGYSTSIFSIFGMDEDVRLIRVGADVQMPCNATSLAVTTTAINWTPTITSPIYAPIILTKTIMGHSPLALPIRDSLLCLSSSVVLQAAVGATGPFCVGNSIQFQDQSTGQITSRSWTFPSGNPSSSTLVSPSVVWNTAGTYTVSLTVSNSNGSSSINYPITIYPLPPAPTITANGNMLISSSAVSYQWYLNSVAIPNATNDTLIVSTSGTYSVEITDSNGCTSLSAPIVVTDLSNTIMTNGISVYPNPASDKLSIYLQMNLTEKTEYHIIDILGQTVGAGTLTNTQGGISNSIDISHLTDGSYILIVKSGDAMMSKNFVVIRL